MKNHKCKICKRKLSILAWTYCETCGEEVRLKRIKENNAKWRENLKNAKHRKRKQNKKN